MFGSDQRRKIALRNPSNSKKKTKRKILFYYAGIPFFGVILLVVWFDAWSAMRESVDSQHEISKINTMHRIEETKNKDKPPQTIHTPSGATLPSAKQLLTQPPPYDQSRIIRLSDNLITSPNTIVTAYHQIRSKYNSDTYDGWMLNMLSLQDAMIIFTEAKMVDQIQQLRSHALNRTVIVRLEIDELPIGSLYQKSFWQDQLDRDPEKRHHRSYELFWIWLSKSWCVSQAINMNIFESDLFMWSDIGSFRNQRYNFKTLIQHREQVPTKEMMQMAHHKPNPPNETLFQDKYSKKANFYHGGSHAVAFKDTWMKFHELFLEVIDKFLERNMLIVDDQLVLQSVCLSNPEMCAYVPTKVVRDNNYFGLRKVLHDGGHYELWRHSNL